MLEQFIKEVGVSFTKSYSQGVTYYNVDKEVVHKFSVDAEDIQILIIVLVKTGRARLYKNGLPYPTGRLGNIPFHNIHISIPVICSGLSIIEDDGVLEVDINHTLTKLTRTNFKQVVGNFKNEIKKDLYTKVGRLSSFLSNPTVEIWDDIVSDYTYETELTNPIHLALYRNFEISLSFN